MNKEIKELKDKKKSDKKEEISNKELHDILLDIDSRVKTMEDDLIQKNHKIEEIKKFMQIDQKNITNKIQKFKQLDKQEQIKKIHEIQSSSSFYDRFKNAFSQDLNIDPSRLLSLVDGIFGMVITLLAFGIALPETTITSSINFNNFIINLLPNIGVVLISFAVISTFWIYHHEFIKVKTLNLPFIWLNIAYLACISFIPFSTTVIGTYSHFFYAEVIFGINILFTNVSFLIMHYYAMKNDMLEEKITKTEEKYRINTFRITMGLTIIVNLLDFFISPKFIYLFLLMPVISTLRDIKIRKLLE